MVSQSQGFCRVAILNSILDATGSQWSSLSSGLALPKLALMTTRANAFCWDQSLAICDLGEPYRIELA